MDISTKVKPSLICWTEILLCSGKLILLWHNQHNILSCKTSLLHMIYLVTNFSVVLLSMLSLLKTPHQSVAPQWPFPFWKLGEGEWSMPCVQLCAITSVILRSLLNVDTKIMTVKHTAIVRKLPENLYTRGKEPSMPLDVLKWLVSGKSGLETCTKLFCNNFLEWLSVGFLTQQLSPW